MAGKSPPGHQLRNTVNSRLIRDHLSMPPKFWPEALYEYFAGLLQGEDRLKVIAPWGQDQVINALRWHKIEPLARELHLASPHPLPEFQALFQAEHLRQLFRDEIIQGQIKEIAEVYEAAQIEFLVLKGPLWGERIYASAQHRHQGDIDLLVRPENRDLAIDLLFKLGHVLHRGWTLEYYLIQKCEVVFEIPQERWQGQTIVELHWHPINADKLREYHRRRRLTVDCEDFFRWAQPTLFRTFSLLLPRPEIWFAYQIVHGICQHQLDRLLPLVDLAYIIKNYPQLDYHFLVELMRKWKALIPLYLGLKILWLFGFKEGSHLEILEVLENVMPRHIRSSISAISPQRLLLSYTGKGKIMRKLIRSVSTTPLDVKF
jgi:hypothetical protein